MSAAPPERQSPGAIVRFLGLKPGEGLPLLSSALLFFTILTTVFVVRAMRETISTIAGKENLGDVWIATFAFATVANIAYWWLVNRAPRRRFVTWSLQVCAACFVVFWLGIGSASGDSREAWAYAFYAWYSAFNMCVVSLFWVCMVDDFGDREGRRLFGPIAVGGTLGAMAGSVVAAFAIGRFGAESLFALAAIGCQVATICYLWRERIFAKRRDAGATQRVIANAGVFEGLRQVASTPTLRWFAVLIIAMTAAQTGFYLFQADFVPQLWPDEDDRATYFAWKDFATQALTLTVQLLITSRVLRSFGVAGGLVLVPAFVAVGLVATSLWPAIALLAVTHVCWDAGRHALVRPAREVLFTPLDAEAKYKSKTFLDSLLYRGSDAAWAKLFSDFVATSMLLWAMLPFAGVWIAVGFVLGRGHERRSRDDVRRAD